MVQSNKLIIFCLFSCFILVSTKITRTNTLQEDNSQSNQAQTPIQIFDPIQSINNVQQNDQVQGRDQQITSINSRILQKETESIQNKQQQKDDQKVGQKKRRKVFDCIMYMGENHILKLRFLVMSSFVDYFIISEGTHSQTGKKKDLVFDYGQFPQYAHKILYIPVQYFPNVGNITLEQQWENNHHGRNSAARMLKKYAKDDDIVIIGDTDELLSREGFQKFNPELHPWVGTEQIQYYYYFNRMSIYDSAEFNELPHIWTTGTKLTTYKVVRDRFNNELIPLKRGFGCDGNFPKGTSYDPLTMCICPLIRHAGWHLSYVLNDADLLKKFTHFVDGRANFTITNYTNIRSSNPARQHYLQDFSIEDADLPIELKNDILINKQKSIFYQYIVKFVPNQGCQYDEVEKSTGKKKLKTRIVLNLWDPKNRNITKHTECVKAQIQQKDSQNKQKELANSKQGEHQSQNEKQATQKQINQDSEEEGFFSTLFLTVYFYFSTICVIVWIISKKGTKSDKVQQEKQFDDDTVVSSQRDGLKKDENKNISIV